MFPFAHAYRWLTVAGWYMQPRMMQVRRNQKRLDHFVIGFDDLCSDLRRRGRPRRHALLFTHVPKTGGTTLEHIAARNYPINGTIQINSQTLHRNPNALFKSGTFPKAVLGHHNLNQVLYRFVDRPIVHVTMLRNPVERIISHFRYLRSSPNHAIHEQVKELSLEEYVASDLSPELGNAQTLRLAGLLHKRAGRPPTDPKAALRIAMENLKRRFSFFGLTDRYIEFLLMCRRLLGWKDIFAERRNVSRTSEPEIIDAVVERIEQRNALDVQLYRFAADLFEARRSALEIEAPDIEQYQQMNAAYVRLLQGEKAAEASSASEPPAAIARERG